MHAGDKLSLRAVRSVFAESGFRVQEKRAYRFAPGLSPGEPPGGNP